ncbi:MAG TPA: hypothetical protein VFP87_00615 [Chitinophagaceae bacterium]|nr:hypothetical protein [Chitinophagaceae bacterium]
MRNVLTSLTLIATIIFTTPCCKKSSTSIPPEQDLIVTTDAASYTIIPDPVFTFKLKVESTMPAAGVRIEYTVVSEIDHQNYPQGPPISTYSTTKSITLSGLPRQKICICTIKVTSLSKSTNVATTGFRVGYK